ncbi:aromatic motif membrane protein [Mycoplasmopsis ciconiae]|uniref:Aromatic motif membrane protein n=1 Tax=Mycoplasmopsis ciconiae TaxID=561067 RepID=A0ABU7MN18_9BACT|nr:aromatic motif membrane protein [Mycoplasmopsis ciconiae]
MKKLLKTLSILSISSPCFLALSCSNINNSQSTLTQKPKEESQIKKFDTKILDTIFFQYYSENELKVYKDIQSKIPLKMVSTLKYALLYRPYFRNILTSQSYERIRQNSENVIKETLNTNIYWFLENINKFNFFLYAYGNKYKSNEYDEDFYKENSEWVQKIEDLSIQKVVQKNLSEDIKINFLIFSDNYFFVILENQKNPKNNLTLIPEFFEMENISDLEMFYKQINLSRNKRKQLDIDYIKKISDADSLEKNIQDLENKYSWDRFANLFDEFNYFDDFFDSVFELNKANIKIKRYVLGG